MVAFSPDSKHLAAVLLDTINVWDAATGEKVLVLEGHDFEGRRPKSYLTGLAFSPDGKRLATSSSDTTVRLWDAASGREVLVLHGHVDIVDSVAFSPDGKRLASIPTTR